MNCVSIRAQSTPGKVVRDLGREIERGLSEHLSEIVRARILVEREDAMGATSLNDMNDIGI
jgi:hypothetical protein